MRKKIISGLIIYIILLFILLVYSYSQIDLNLTLSSNNLYQEIQSQLINLGYYNRFLSGIIFTLLISFLFLVYSLFLGISDRLPTKTVRNVVLLSVLILIFSYPAFSHDIFNYMFDARIVTKYFSNPYIHTALDYPDDLWIRFMHWTHRRYPYGPVWLIITLIPSFLGFGKFVLTLFNFKLIFSIFHLGNVSLIYKILEKINPGKKIRGVIFYAFNPLIIIESLVSPHNEVMMLTFMLWGIYFTLVNKNIFLPSFSIVLSAGIKFVTVIFLPWVLLVRKIFQKWQHEDKISLLLVLLTPVFVYEIYLKEAYSWYFILFIALGALIKNNFLKGLIITFSYSLLLRYLPFILLGSYTKDVYFYREILATLPIGIYFCCSFFRWK